MCHEENRWNYNYFSRKIFWKKLQLNLLGGKYFFKKFDERGGKGPNKKGEVRQKSQKLTSEGTLTGHSKVLESTFPLKYVSSKYYQKMFPKPLKNISFHHTKKKKIWWNLMYQSWKFHNYNFWGIRSVWVHFIRKLEKCNEPILRRTFNSQKEWLISWLTHWLKQ